MSHHQHHHTVTLHDCQVTFKEKSQLKLKSTLKDGDVLHEALAKSAPIDCIITLSQQEIHFLGSLSDKDPFCSIQASGLATSLDTNSQYSGLLIIMLLES